MTKQYKTATIQVERIQYYHLDIVVPANLDREDLIEWLESENDVFETMVAYDPGFEEFANHDADVDSVSFTLSKNTLNIRPDYWVNEEGFWIEPHDELKKLKTSL